MIRDCRLVGLQFTSADQAYNLGIWRTSCEAPLPPLTLSHCLCGVHLSYRLCQRARGAPQWPREQDCPFWGGARSISEQSVRCELRDRGSLPIQIQTEPAEPYQL